MPWEETSVMDERMKFIGRLLSGEKMAPLCREFGISRVTGHKIWNRYKEYGSGSIRNRSRAPRIHPNQIPHEVELLIVRLKREKPNWGAPKIRELISRRYPTIKLPAISTVHCALERNGLVDKKRRRRKKFTSIASYLSTPKQPNDLWCTDFKGQFRMKNKNYCFPLTITDFTSRYIITCEALNSTKTNPCYAVFEEAFNAHGLPQAIRSDNGVPFACGNSLWGMTRLSVWWIRLGIQIERIAPGCPQENGRHERMHRTLKLEATKPPGSNLLQQQERFFGFVSEFNAERPHQALNMRCPGEIYERSHTPYRGLSDITYPGFDKELLISNCGRICMNRMKIHISRAFANQPVGLREVDDNIWEVCFMEYKLGYFDAFSKTFSPTDDPFGIKLDKVI
ncbi:integrase core domain-containing protein [Acidobacteriota bacterium]